MYVDKCAVKSSGKTYTRYLLRESRREGKKTVKTTILNITPWGEQTCEAIRFALKNQGRIEHIDAMPGNRAALPNDLTLTQAKPVGDVWLLHQLAVKTGLADAIGDTDKGRLALWQVMAMFSW